MFNLFSAQGYVIKQPHVGMAGQTPVTHITLSVQTSTVRDEVTGYYPSQIVEISYFGSLAAVAANYLSKGSLLTFAGVVRGVQTYVRPEDGTVSTTLKVDGQQLQLPPRAAAEPEAPAAAPAAPAPAPEPTNQPVVGRIGRRRQPADVPPEAFAG